MKLGQITVVAVAALLVAGASVAQQPAAPAAPATPPANAPAGGTPATVPFDVPYGVSIGEDKAKQVLAAAETEAKKRNWKMNIAVVDTNGDLVAFERMDGAQLASITIAQHKARTAARYRRETVAFENAVQKFGFNYILSLDDVVASRGGIPLVEGGKLIGAIGCSGGTGSQDEATCKAATGTVK
jgi:glc operon protein GlcG